MMKSILENLRLLGIVLYILRHWFEVLHWPSLILIVLSSLGLLFYWRSFSRSTNLWNIAILIIAILVMAGF